MWLRALGAASSVPVAVAINDHIVSAHVVRADERAAAVGLAPGDVVLVDRLSWRMGAEPRRGDVVLLAPPDAPWGAPDRCAKLEALPGDWLPGRAYERVPPGRAWVAAAAKDDAGARDSAHGWGVTPLALVHGRVTHVLWPPTHARAVPRAARW